VIIKKNILEIRIGDRIKRERESKREWNNKNEIIKENEDKNNKM
jgi:hypothetical protein